MRACLRAAWATRSPWSIEDHFDKFVIVYMDTRNFVVVKTETPSDQEFWSCRDRDSLRPEILKLSRPRLFETRNFGVVETETS